MSGGYSISNINKQKEKHYFYKPNQCQQTHSLLLGSVQNPHY